MTDLLFDTPWWLPTAIVIVGVIVFVAGNNRGKASMRNAGIGIVLLAVAVGVVGYFVDTDVEKVQKRTDLLVESVAKRDWPTFRSLLEPTASIFSYRGADELTEGARLSAEKINLRGATIIGQTMNVTPPLITIEITVLSEQDMPPGPFRSRWQFDWQESRDGWLLRKGQLIEFGNQSVDRVQRELPSVPRK